MNASYNWLKTFFEKPLPLPQKLADILTLHSFENESLVKKGNDYILGLDVLPDRAGDCLSHLGIARECSAILNLKLSEPKIKIKEEKKTKTKNFLQVEIKNKKDCRRYTARVLFDVKIKPSPKWVQDRLIACGLSPINNVVDATNYVMLEMGQPLHAFDYENISQKKIIIRRASDKEKLTSLSGLEYKLNNEILVIADPEKPLALAGIKGGQKAEINSKTKTIILESANFNPKLISQTARKINLRTDASIRFEQNLDPNLTEKAINRLAMLIQEFADAKIAQGLIDIYPEKTLPKKLMLDFKKLNNVLGLEIQPSQVFTILKRLNMGVLQKDAKKFTVQIPTFRQDITIPENLIEEIGRIHGYEKIIPCLPCDFLAPVKRNNDLFWQNQTKDILKELGYIEIYNYSFISQKEKDIFKADARKIKNPVSSDFEYLRPSLVFQLFSNAKENLKTFKQFKIFELNKVFLKEKNKTKEVRKIAGLVIDMEKDPQAVFSKIRGEINYLLNKLGCDKINYLKNSDEIFWDKQNTLSLISKNKNLGFFGQVSPEFAENFGIKEKMFVFDFDFEKLQSCCSEEKTFEPISFHPPALRDISGLVDENISLEEIINALSSSIKEIEKPNLKIKAELADIYKNKSLINKKSVTINIKLQHLDKTLSSEEINKAVNHIIKNFSQKLGWEERK